MVLIFCFIHFRYKILINQILDTSSLYYLGSLHKRFTKYVYHLFSYPHLLLTLPIQKNQSRKQFILSLVSPPPPSQVCSPVLSTSDKSTLASGPKISPTFTSEGLTQILVSLLPGLTCTKCQTILPLNVSVLSNYT